MLPSSDLRVMIVDDDPSVLATLARGLARQKIDVDAFDDTSQALLYLETGRYDAVVADQVLPGALCGHEFLLAAQQVDPAATTVLLSGEDVGARDLCSERFDATARKPISPTQLVELIMQLRPAPVA